MSKSYLVLLLTFKIGLRGKKYLEINTPFKKIPQLTMSEYLFSTQFKGDLTLHHFLALIYKAVQSILIF